MICRNINAHSSHSSPHCCFPNTAQTRCFNEASVNVLFAKNNLSKVLKSKYSAAVKWKAVMIDCVGGMTVCVQFERNSLEGFQRNDIHNAIMFYCFYTKWILPVLKADWSMKYAYFPLWWNKNTRSVVLNLLFNWDLAQIKNALTSVPSCCQSKGHTFSCIHIWTQWNSVS